MNDDGLIRYSRQILLPQVGIAGQEKLAAATVLLIGVGGLGSPIALYLGAAGVGRLVMVDPDVVDLSNLQRQVAFDERDIGRPKAVAAAARVQALNPSVRTETVVARLSRAELAAWVRNATVVVDASDNFETRNAVNEACVAARRPLVSGAAIRLEGKVAVFRHDRPGMACYGCVFDGGGDLGESCSDSGILGPVVGLIGSIQAMEAMRVILDLEGDSRGGCSCSMHDEWSGTTWRFASGPTAGRAGQADHDCGRASTRVRAQPLARRRLPAPSRAPTSVARSERIPR